jgi:hypothetical protein
MPGSVDLEVRCKVKPTGGWRLASCLRRRAWSEQYGRAHEPPVTIAVPLGEVVHPRRKERFARRSRQVMLDS